MTSEARERLAAAAKWWLATIFACVGGLGLVLAAGHRVVPGPGLTLVVERPSDSMLFDLSFLTIGFAALTIATLQGLMQWLVMRERLSWAGAWVVATGVGGTVAVFGASPGVAFVLGLLQCLAVVFRVRPP
jgi:hypothetical protein